LLACCTWLAGCGVKLESAASPDGSSMQPDAAPSDGAGDAAPLGPWGTPAPIAGAATGEVEDDGSLSSTGNELVFARVDQGTGNKHLWYMSRASAAAAWSAPVQLGFNSTASDETPRFSPDDLTLYFSSARAGGLGNLDIYRVTRPSVGGAWGTPQLVPGVSTTGADKWFMPCATGNTYLTILGQDIGQGTIGNPPTVCAELSSTATETGTFLTSDCLTVYFASTRSGTNKLYRAQRAAIGATWGAPVVVDDFGTLGGAQEDPWLSPDLRMFVFASDKAGTKDLYLSTR
jgi:Tol biopolymer transport system component